MKLRFVPIICIPALVGILTYTFSQTSFFPLDDHFAYQAFIEALAHGRLDLSIPGFHGSDILAVPWYWISRSSTAQIEFQIFAAVLLPLCAYLAGKALFRSQIPAVLFACILSLQPFIIFVALRGWTGPAYWDLMLLSIAATRRFPWISVLCITLAILTKPFAVALLPLLFWLLPGDWSRNKRWGWIVAVLALCMLYLALQYVQVGRIIVGSHAGVDQFSVWQGPKRIILNLAHSLQILFSVHNYYFPDPARTGPGNLMHTTPLLVFLGLINLLSVRTKHRALNVEVEVFDGFHRALLVGIGIGIGLNALLDHMDHFYMEAAVLLFIIAAVPELLRRLLWIPLVLATLHFQWLYFFLEYREEFALGQSFFLLPVAVDFLFLITVFAQRRKVSAILRAIW